MMNPVVKQLILDADAKALATCADNDVHVIPVSFIRIAGEKIWLVDIFMEKTIDNIMRNPRASLACWKDTMGYQLKGSVEYLRRGDLFDETCLWVFSMNPERKVKGLILFTPREIIDISPDKDTEKRMKERLSL